MKEEEYYSRLKKLENRLSTDRISADENYYIECQKNYLSKKYIETIEEESKELHSIIKEVRELLNQEWYSVLRKETITKAREILDKVDKEKE